MKALMKSLAKIAHDNGTAHLRDVLHECHRWQLMLIL